MSFHWSHGYLLRYGLRDPAHRGGFDDVTVDGVTGVVVGARIRR